LSHAVYPDVEAFAAALADGRVRRIIEESGASPAADNPPRDSGAGGGQQ
jgi:hypothetical protein